LEKEMNLYVFQEVLSDYTSGMAIISAETLEQAQQIAYTEFSWAEDADVSGFLTREPGFRVPVATYSVGSDVVAGVRHVIWGGA
jgi:hypothetical protein